MQTKRGSTVPIDVANAIRANPDALAGFESMPPSHQHEYLDAIEEAKKPETRARRITKTVETLAAWNSQCPSR